MIFTKYNVTIEFLEPILGTVPGNPLIYTDFIAAKNANMTTDQLSEEIESLPFIDPDKQKTGFHKLPDGTPFLYDYLVKGFFKEACGHLRRKTDAKSAKLAAYKRVITGGVFVFPRQIPLVLSGPLTELQRPLRAETAQGPRVALAFSDMAPAETKMQFQIDVLEDKVVPQAMLEEWLGYGAYQGLGQWRSGGYGRFSYTIERA